MAEEDIPKSGEAEPVDLSGLGSFDFTPAWAKGDASDTSKFKRFEAREERREEAAKKPQGDRRPTGERRPQDARRQFGDRERDRGRADGDRRQGGQRREERPQRSFTKPMDADIRILPNQKELGPILRKIQTSHCAYPLKNLAYFFLDHPEACVLRVTPKKNASGEAPVFHQCKTCGWAAMDADSLLAHVVSAHMGDYYSAEEIECDPPKGAFTCVAKCGLSGELLGPPNLHGYDARIREMLRTRYPGMSEEEYRSRIVNLHDSESIEEWRKSAVKKTIYRLKKAPAAADAADGVTESPALEREVAEAEFRRTLAPALMGVVRTLDIAADVALKSPDRAFVYACRDAIAKERRFPASLFYALRGAFHHRKLVFFRANDPRGPEFVSAVAFSPLDCEHAVPELAEIVKYVEAHPDATRASIRPDQSMHLEWLIEKGHLVGYFNGALAVPCENPIYRPPRKPQPPTQPQQQQQQPQPEPESPPQAPEAPQQAEAQQEPEQQPQPEVETPPQPETPPQEPETPPEQPEAQQQPPASEPEEPQPAVDAGM